METFLNKHALLDDELEKWLSFEQDKALLDQSLGKEMDEKAWTATIEKNDMRNNHHEHPAIWSNPASV